LKDTLDVDEHGMETTRRLAARLETNGDLGVGKRGRRARKLERQRDEESGGGAAGKGVWS
jgi:hypothetical protein